MTTNYLASASADVYKTLVADIKWVSDVWKFAVISESFFYGFLIEQPYLFYIIIQKTVEIVWRRDKIR